MAGGPVITAIASGSMYRGTSFAHRSDSGLTSEGLKTTKFPSIRISIRMGGEGGTEGEREGGRERERAQQRLRQLQERQDVERVPCTNHSRDTWDNVNK